jgi:flagellar hook assembly protein FlgD
MVLILLVSVGTMAALLVEAPAEAVFMSPSLSGARRDGVITDPAQTEGRSVTVDYSVQNPTQTVTWDLVNSGDIRVIGPVSLGSVGPGAHSFVFDPTAAHGSALPDGAYRIVLTISAAGETPLSDQATVHLAQNPARVSTVDVLEAQRDVWPGFRRSRIHVVDRSHGLLSTRLLPGVVLPEFGSASPAMFTVRSSAGSLIRRDTVSGSSFGDGGTDDHYEWTWGGTNQAGTVRPPGNYAVTLTANDNWGRSTTVPVGSMRIGHKVTRRLTVRFSPRIARYPAFTVKGRCSSITYPGPHGWPGSAGLLSGTRCPSRRGTADQVFKSFYLHRWRDTASRILSVRVDAFGTPMRRRQHATLVLQTGTRNVAWRRLAVLRQGLRWHNGTTYRRSEPANGQLTSVAQVRVTDGNRYDLRYLRATWTFKDWTR